MDLPLDLFPERGNRDRLRSLFSEQTELSEDSLRFWRRMILAYAKHRGKFHLSPQELEVNFTVEGELTFALPIILTSPPVTRYCSFFSLLCHYEANA